jgi:hypothetical protein
MKRIVVMLSLAGLAALLASCASQPLALAPVGPGPLARPASSPPKGDLQVFTETEEYYEDEMCWFPHTDYQIYTEDGKRLKRVWNHHDNEDEFPATVALPPGKYVVKASAEFYGTVSVPVIIKPNETTTVILQPGWKPGNVSRSDLVRMPNGYFVGWRADSVEDK